MAQIPMRQLAESMLMTLCLIAGVLLSPEIPRSHAALSGFAQQPPPAGRVRVVTPFDSNWRFLKADLPGAEEPGFDDASWRKLDVPHDWSIEGPFDDKNPAGGAGAFLPAGVGWYRKHFNLPAAYAPRLVFIEFDGVMANS